ncbi:PDZ domain-containing protein [Ferrimonas balearica]|nr:PDZ domain-containing protein [Ferrimonas balearica]
MTFLGTAFMGLGLGALTLTTVPRNAPDPHLAPVNSTPTQPSFAGSSARPWPALFGTPEAAPTSVAVENTPTSTQFGLKGLVAAGEAGWAIVSGPDGDRLVNPGSELAAGIAVTAIRATGVEISRNGRTEVIVFDEESQPGTLALTETVRAAPGQVATSTLSLKQLQTDGFRRTLGLAGGAKSVDRGDGAMAQQVVWVRKGRFFDQLGLREGDIVLAINGYETGDLDALSNALPELLRQRSFTVEIQRSGAPMTLEVSINEDA